MISNDKSSKILRFGTCSKDCYGSCVFLGEWDDTASEFKFISAKPLKNHPFTNGFLCAKYNHREKMIYHPQRIKQALIRDGNKGKNQFKSINLEKALEIISTKLIQVKKDFGAKSILAAFNAGNYGLISRFGPLRFFGKLGSSITTGGICNEGGCAGLDQLFGTYSSTNPLQIINSATNLIVIWGSDLSNKNIHAYYLIKQALRRGVKLIVIDSRKTKLAEKAHCFINIKPGCDFLLAQVIIKRIIARNNYDINFLKNHTDGYKEILAKGVKFNDNIIISDLEIDNQELDKFLDLLIKFKHQTLFNIGYGIQKYFYGGRIVQIIALIQILLGNFGKSGTGIIYSQSDFNKKFSIPILKYITKITPDSDIFETDLIKLGTTLSSDKFKMVFIYNFNPASSLPDQNQVINALMRKDLFIVVIDCFLNQTTKYANIVIPSKFDLETYDLITPYYIPGISINQGGPCPYQDCISNYEFFQRLASKIGFKADPIFNEDQETIFKNSLILLPIHIRKSLEDQGYYLLFDHKSVPFKELNFPTHNGRIQLYNIKLDLERKLLEILNKYNKKEFFLITPSHKKYIHSQFGQLHPESLEVFKKIFLCSSDIKRLKLTEGDKIIVTNSLGSAIYVLAENNTLIPGVALIYSGSPLGSKNSSNVNIFIPNKPEELGFSGAYNSAKILIMKKEQY